MSLVLLSNDNTTAQFEGGGIAQANSWTNVLQTPMIIPKNAEVALQSLRVNKAATTAIDFHNNTFGLYIGQGRDGSGNLPDGPDEDTRYVSPVTLVSGDYTAQSFVDKSLLPALREGVFHPDYQDRINASVEETATGDFEGYNIKFGEGDTPPSDVFPSDSEFIAAGVYDGEPTEYFTWTNSNKRFTRAQNPAAPELRGYGIATRYPLSVRQGTHVANFANAGDEWAIGLSRYADGAKQIEGLTEGYFSIPGWAQESAGDWYDFGAIKEDDKLLIYHAVVQDDSKKLKMREVKYYGYTGAEMTEAYDLGTNASGFNEVEFFLDGEQVNVYLSKSGGGRTLICSPDLGTPGKDNYLKPINQSCQYLYPKYEVVTDAAYITMVHNTGVDVQNFKYDGVNDDNTLTFQDFYATGKVGPFFVTPKEPLSRANKILNMCRIGDIDTVYNDFTPDHIGDEHVFLKYSATLPTIALIVAPDTTYYKPSNRANAANVLGFDGETVVDNPVQTTGFKTFTSHETPKNLVRNSMFCRLTSLTQKSSNGFTGNESKILYHCPRFDNAGRDSGELYYEPAEKTYLDISNPSDIQVNSFSVDFVTRDEVLINGMMGNSTVMLHIREKK